MNSIYYNILFKGYCPNAGIPDINIGNLSLYNRDKRISMDYIGYNDISELIQKKMKSLRIQSIYTDGSILLANNMVIFSDGRIGRHYSYREQEENDLGYSCCERIFIQMKSIDFYRQYKSSNKIDFFDFYKCFKY